MGTIRLFKVWFVICLMVLSGASLAFAQFSDCGGNTCTNDNVGIGTTSPDRRLHILSNADYTHSTSLFRSSGATMVIQSAEPGILLSQDINSGGTQTGAETAVGGIGFGYINSGNFNNLRVGTISNHNLIIATNDVDRVRIDNSGKVGIGTTSPQAKFHTYGRSSYSGYGHVTGIFETDGTGANQVLLADSSGVLGGLQSAGTVMSILGPDGANAVNVISGGNVGIGTRSPTSMLHVAGAAKITGNTTVDGDISAGGNIAAKYQDVAEWVRAPARLAPGTVVVIDPAESNRVLPSFQSYDTRIAGVVSSQPGIILGEAGDDKAKVAHSGRVKVKVDAQFGSILVGDLLVSSATTGYAMRSTPIEMNGISLHRPGTIVGKALEPLKEGEGEILVLLTLQ